MSDYLYQMGITIGGKHSYRGLGLYISSRSIGFPEVRRSTVTVPYMSGYYDFSYLYGGPYYGGRTLTYAFDLIEDTPEALESAVKAVYAWAAQAQDSALYDDDDPDYYFVASLSEASFAPSSDLPECGGTITLAFTAQPYRQSRTDGGEAVI